MKPASNNPLADLLRAMRQDPRKVSVLGALLLILGFMIFRQVTSSPTAASAASETVSPENQPQASIETNTPFASRNTKFQTTNPVVEWLDQPTEPLSRNLFAVNLDLFPTDTPSIAAFVAEGPRIWDEIAKSLLDHADQQERKQEMLSNLQAQASALQVTSVMMGPKPRAVIHGELVGEGDVVQQFRVLKIEPRRIVVERDGTKLEINIK